MDTAEKTRRIAARADMAVLTEHLGECYHYALEKFLGGEGEELIHGTIQIAGRPLKHAWVRFEGGRVWDPTTNSRWAADEYAEVFGAVERVSYSRDRALALALSLCHFGPWDDFPNYDDDWGPRAITATEAM